MPSRYLRMVADWLSRVADRLDGSEPQESEDQGSTDQSQLLRGGVDVPAASNPVWAGVLSASLRQGEILTNVVRWQAAGWVGTEDPELLEIQHPIAIIASQDCDLVQDFNARNSGKTPQFPCVLLYEVVAMATMLARVEGTSKTTISQNKSERYHVLEAMPQHSDAAGEGFPDLGIDFKRYFTIPTEDLYGQIGKNARRRGVLLSPYLEHFATRAAAFQGRIALPIDHRVTVPKK